ncbi:sugar ABC transporter permease [Corallococcus exiguus]|uniref:carbohydrate ABC transporter permease n=1 Tax=Corallococcus TaxID=83461 RepID=UPI000EBF8D4E|nr:MULTISPECIES: sugar ABC transporter permease [Corallococcus]NNB95321.1 sugar ABC transporter permease [Corallococcus exiguus]NNC07855.1 sugar ABC transporter permease [Corallococcus exiguus]NRD61827.1 sugar ABC transporter permease [Corallococcus exiguus]RKI03440.1 sugar ABC transporter permease [Corallococcus sp. AB038B]
MRGAGSQARERRQAYLLVAPAVVVLAVVALYPVLAAIWLSLHRYILVFGERRFTGLENYAYLMGDARFWSALGNTAYFTAVAVTVELLLAVPLALLLNRAFPGRGLLRASVLVPWAIPTVVSARLWAWMFNPDYGLINRLLGGAEINWLGAPGYALHAAILVDVWKTTPFVALLVLAGLQGIPEDLYKAARVDGASGWRQFRSITMPLLKPALLLAVLFRSLDAFRVFDAIYVLTEGGPANTTETLSIYAYKTLMRSGDFGYGSTLSVATFLCVVLLAVVWLRWLGREEGRR